MRVAVTGSQGTIGAPLVRELRKRGHEVFGVEAFHTADPFTVRADVAEYRQLEDAFRRIEPDLVFHLAAEFGRINGEEFYEQVWATNAVGTRNVLELQRRMGFRHIFASSSEVYGDAGDGLLYEGLLDERQPRLTNDYAISKRVNEEQVRNFADRYGTETMVLRFFNAYGPGERYHSYRSVVCLFVYRALAGLPYQVFDGYRRVFMYVADFVRTLANSVDRFRAGETYNVGGDEYVAVKDMSDLVLETVGRDDSLVEYLPQDKHNVVSKRPDITKAVRDLGHRPDTRLEVGIPLTVQWMRDTYGF